MENNKSVVPVDTAGIVTLSEPLMMADGVEHRYIWAREWVEVPKPGEPKAESKKLGDLEYIAIAGGQFQGLVAMVGEDVEVLVPWEMVIGWARCEKVPERTDVYLCVKVGDGEE